MHLLGINYHISEDQGLREPDSALEETYSFLPLTGSWSDTVTPATSQISPSLPPTSWQN